MKMADPVEEYEPVEAVEYSWRDFTRVKKIKASMEDIYNAWTSSKGIESWFLQSSEYKDKDGRVRGKDERIQTGDTYEWTWFGYDGKEENRIIEANGEDRIVFGFADVCTVTVSIKPWEHGHEVELVQTGIPLDEKAKVNWHLGCSVGWAIYLMNLKSIMEGGLDLRIKEGDEV